VSQVERRTNRQLQQADDLEPIERAWLAERLVEYRELLDYLHDH
jgi:hypothetical protein